MDDLIDTNLKKGAAALDRARISRDRADDLEVTATACFEKAHIDWMALPLGERQDEPWEARHKRVIPNVGATKMKALLSGKTPEQADADEMREDHRKKLAEEYGFPYYTPEERANIHTIWAAERARTISEVRASVGSVGGASPRVEAKVTTPDFCLEQKTHSQPAPTWEAPKNTGDWAVQAVESNLTPVKQDMPDTPEARAIAARILVKISSMSLEDLIDLEGYIDALTYPLRKR